VLKSEKPSCIPQDAQIMFGQQAKCLRIHVEIFGVPPTATRTTEHASKPMSCHDDDDNDDGDTTCLETLRSDYTLT